jgi:hypothetical protein
MKYELMFLGVFLVLALIASLLPSATAEPSDNLTIDVQIGSVAELRLNDTGTTSVNFGSVNPGANSSDVLIRAYNVGSTTLSDLYAGVDTLNLVSSNPRSTGTDSDWATTNFLALANESGAEFYYVGKIAWNYSSSEDSSGFTFSGSPDAWGEFWGGGDTDPDDFWYWQLTGNGGDCADAAASLTIQNTRGSQNMGTGTSMLNDDQNADWAAFTVESGPWAEYCVYAYTDCTRLYITRWDMNITFPACGEEDYVHTPSMSPGNYHDFYLKQIIPFGVPDGDPTDTTLRVYATST